jgi:hypothetical protein
MTYVHGPNNFDFLFLLLQKAQAKPTDFFASSEQPWSLSASWELRGL